MAIRGIQSFTLEVPAIDEGVRFYSDAGLVAQSEGDEARLHCAGQDRPSVILLGGFEQKRLHHVALRADDLAGIANRVGDYGGAIVAAPPGFDQDGLWLVDPHGTLFHLLAVEEPSALPASPQFMINGPGRFARVRRSAILPRSQYAPVAPLRLGHVLLFSPDVPASVTFMTGALGMGLADQAQDVIAFCCCRMNSDHHVVAFAKSPGIGFHHASFQVADPDEVGRGGRGLVNKAMRGDWGFGRHTIGSNFFHYIQDPWGSWFEYYADMDFIDDHSLWTSTNYGMEDALASWGPAVPNDFVKNYEVEQ